MSDAIVAFSFLWTCFFKTGFDVNALKNASRPFHNLSSPRKRRRICQRSLDMLPSFFFFFLVSMGWALVGNDGSTFLVGLSHFWYSGLWDLLKGIEEYTNICIFIYVYFLDSM